MVKLNTTSENLIKKGEIPLSHDCILKVVYLPDCGLRFQFFTCRLSESAEVVSILSSLSIVREVVITHVNDFIDYD